jgi:hypothetical protein
LCYHIAKYVTIEDRDLYFEIEPWLKDILLAETKDWFFEIEPWLEESKRLFWRISEISDYDVRRDLFGIYHNVDNLTIEIMREQVRCKTFKFQSREHKRLVEKFTDYRQNLIEQLTYGLLCS